VAPYPLEGPGGASDGFRAVPVGGPAGLLAEIASDPVSSPRSTPVIRVESPE